MLTHRGLIFGIIGSALAVGALTSAYMRPEAKLTSAESCYGPCSTITALSLSRRVVFYGHEQAVRFTVVVRPALERTGTPTGTVAVKSQATTLCTVTLSGGIGSCSPTAEALPVGFYKVVAVYSGDSSFGGSTSLSRSLLIFRGLSRHLARVAGTRVRMEHQAAREP